MSLKYAFTDNIETFLARIDRIAENALKQTGDNLKYLELKERIRRVRSGETDIFVAFPLINKK